MDSFKQQNPEWRHLFHLEDDWAKLLENNDCLNPYVLYSYRTSIQRADIFRIAVLYEFGGIYADLDYYALRPLDALIQACVSGGYVDSDTELIITTDHPIHRRDLFQNQNIFANGFLIATPKSRALKLLLTYFTSKSNEGFEIPTDPISTTGPLALTRLIEENGGLAKLGIATIPYQWLHPLPDMILSFPEKSYYHALIEERQWNTAFHPYTAHFWWHSYHSEQNMMKVYGETLFL